MDNQTPNSQNPTSPVFPPTTESTTQPVPPVLPTQSVFKQPQPIIQTPPMAQPNISEDLKPSHKHKILIIVVGVIMLLILLAAGIFAYSMFTDNKSIKQLTSDTFSTSIPDDTYNAEKACNSPLAPVGTTDFEKCYYRDTKATIAEAQITQNHVATTIGAIVVPNNINFHEEVYKGIPIKWTDNQPISITTMSWLKQGIDILPPYFYKDHPVTAIISATSEEIGNTGVTPEDLGFAAYASGLNIFITKDTAQGSSTLPYVIDEPNTIHALFHEWIHVVQNYEMLQTYTEEYLNIPGNLIVALPSCPFNKSFAKAAGWVFQGDEYSSSTYAILGTDAESQKQSDYGKTKYIEDMAEAGASFMLCENNKISEARIKWWEQTTGTSRNMYCPSKI